MSLEMLDSMKAREDLIPIEDRCRMLRDSFLPPYNSGEYFEGLDLMKDPNPHLVKELLLRINRELVPYRVRLEYKEEDTTVFYLDERRICNNLFSTFHPFLLHMIKEIFGFERICLSKTSALYYDPKASFAACLMETDFLNDTKAVKRLMGVDLPQRFNELKESIPCFPYDSLGSFTADVRFHSYEYLTWKLYRFFPVAREIAYANGCDIELYEGPVPWSAYVSYCDLSILKK